MVETWLRSVSVLGLWRKTILTTNCAGERVRFHRKATENNKVPYYELCVSVSQLHHFVPENTTERKKKIFRKKVTGARARTVHTPQTQKEAEKKKNHIRSILL